ncbi:MAG TPA: PH domain-containing protein [Terracidiphilus sp.]
MKNVDNILLPNEVVVYHGNLHWMIYKTGALLSLFALVLFYVAFARGGFPFLIFGIVSILWSWWSSKVTIFLVTNKRVIMHQGIIRRQSFEILLKKLESFNVDQPLIGRLFGYGTLKVSSAGSFESFHTIANPVEFRRQISIAADTAQV